MTRPIVLALAAAGAAWCQTQPAATPAECLAKLEQLPRQSMAQKPQLAAECIAAHPLSTTSGPALLDLAKLLAEADQPGNARTAIEKRLREPGLTDSEKGDALLTLVLAAQRGSRSEELRPRSIRAAEEAAPELDKLGDGARWQQVMVYRWLNSYYRGDADENGKVSRVANRYLALYPKLEPSKQKESEPVFGLYCAYENLAAVFATRGDVERAKQILREGMTQVSAPLSKSLQKGLLHYELVGKQAPALEATYWINPPRNNRIGFDGQVTVIEFTANWCIPCKETYPFLMRLHKEFADRGVMTVLATNLYGYFGTEHDLSPEQEVAVDRKYFVEEQKLTLPVAIGPRTADDKNSQNYGVQTIPMIVVVDREGVVRRFFMGVSPTEEAALTALLEELLDQ